MTVLVIVAGGKGSRLKPLIDDLPKVLAPIGAQPNIDRLLALGREFGYRRVIVLAGDGAEQVQRHLAQTQEARDLDIQLVVEHTPGGTAGCFRDLAGNVDERMLVLYGDISCDLDLRRFEDYHSRMKATATILVQPNSHMHDSDLVAVDRNDRITRIDRKPHDPERYYENLTNAAAYILEPDILPAIPDGACDWLHDVFPRMLQKKRALQAYRSWEYLQDFGTPARYEKAQEDVSADIVGARRANGRTAGALFLDSQSATDISDDDIAALAFYNDRRWPVVLFGDVVKVLKRRLNDANVYADFYLDEFNESQLVSVCTRFGFNAARSRIAQFKGLHKSDPADQNL
ncbi:MAG: nucleotidyltransferase family protein [Alphaproteobacteria bacterium]|nr:nucleotidyltransferase family protein [Alphaproteobacteria bacterium]